MADILAGIFLLLAIIALIAGFIGLIKPSIIKQDSRGKAFGKGMVAYFVFCIAFVISIPKGENNKQEVAETSSKEQLISKQAEKAVELGDKDAQTFKMLEPNKKAPDTSSSEKKKTIEPTKPETAKTKTISRKNIEAVIASLKKHYNIDVVNYYFDLSPEDNILDLDEACWNDKNCEVSATKVKIQATNRSVEALTSSKVTPQYYQEVCSAIMIALTGANKALIEQQIPQFFNYASQNGRSKWEMLGIEITVSPDSSGLLGCDFYKPK